MRMRKAARLAGSFIFAIVLMMGLASCGQQGQAPASNSASVSNLTAPYGSPWQTSVITGNIPGSAPKATDDLYLHYAYDYAASHQDGVSAAYAADTAGELQTAVSSVIGNTEISTPELEQLRIFYGQAHDLDALAQTGAGELKPYLEAIANTKSLAELEAVLLGEDFPFSPWVNVSVSASDMKSSMCATVTPHMLFTSPTDSADVYQNAEDKNSTIAREYARSRASATVQAAEKLVSLANDDTAAASLAEKYFALEKTYGKVSSSQSNTLDAEYGAQAKQVKLYSTSELKAACPNFPIVETLAKSGKNAGEGVVVMYPDWLTAFSGIWTEENFELLRGMTEAKVLIECAPFIDPSYFADMRKAGGMGEVTADVNAWAACDKANTFSQLLAKTYVEQTLGDKAVEDLTRLANGLIDTYIELVGDTPWLGAETREAVIDKLDNIALNILYPDGGYLDYSELKLTPTDQGGSLFRNYLALKSYKDRKEVELIGQPARASAPWLNYSPTIQNCFYDRVSNSINIFPGYVTSGIYNAQMGQEELLGGAGFTIGHEISHAFDYEGSQLNAYGQPVSVFKADDVQAYVAKCNKLADYYSTIEVEPGVKVNGNAKIIEATADACSVQVILEYAKAQSIDSEKTLGHLAKSWAAVYPQSRAPMLIADMHPLNNLRINVSAQMCAGFHETFGVKSGDTMYLDSDKRVVFWGKDSQQ